MTKQPTKLSDSLPMTKKAMKQLLGMLQTMRPHLSRTEEDFIDRYLVPLDVKEDKYGNVFKIIGEDPKVAFSCHTDTVHLHEGNQLIAMDDKYMISLHKDSKSNCLGADDTAGVWLMVQLILAKVPGLYLFHRGEECGGKGSRWIATNNPDMVKGIECMIALDRKDVGSIITRQAGGRCCSDEFADSLAGQLKIASEGHEYKKDTGGTFTDSASYTDLVGECTNLSVGYWNQHTSTERVSATYLALLRASLMDLDYSQLVYKRKPGEKEVYNYSGGAAYRYKHYNNNNDDYHGGMYGHNDYNPAGPFEFHKFNHPDFCPSTYLGFYYLDNKKISCDQPSWFARQTFLNRSAQQASKDTKTALVTQDNNKVTVFKKDTDTHHVSSPSARISDEDAKQIRAEEGLKFGKIYFTPPGGKVTEYTMETMVSRNVEEIVMILEEWGFDVPMLYSFVLEMRQKQEAANKANLPTETHESTTH